jgi:hypothetical protein
MPGMFVTSPRADPQAGSEPQPDASTHRKLTVFRVAPIGVIIFSIVENDGEKAI